MSRMLDMVSKTLCLFVLIISLAEAFRPYTSKKIGGKANLGRLPKFSNARKVLVNRKTDTSLSDLFANYEGFSEAFVGGTVGVMSVAIILEMMKVQEDNLEACPYCMGNGEILCAVCCGTGSASEGSCSCCRGRGLVVCINCKGDGRVTPIILQSKAVRDPEYATDGLRKSSVDSP
jgi:hypothetical protein